MYDMNNLKEKEMPKAGTKIDAKVTEIKSGVLGDFIEQSVLDTWKNANANDPAIEIHATTSEGFIRKRTLPTPKNEEVYPSSNLGKWKKTYGQYPHEGQEIYLIADGEGFYQFVL